MSNEALGTVGIRSLVGAVGAADAMTRAANVALIGYGKIGSGLITVMVRGDVGAVKVSADADVVAAANVGQVVSQHVIPGLHTDVEKILPKSLQDVSRCIPASVAGIQTFGRS